jgi:hypothetical protein
MKRLNQPILILAMTAMVLLSCGLPSGLLRESRPPTPTTGPAPATPSVPAVERLTPSAPAVDSASPTPPALAALQVQTETVKEESKTPPSPYVIDLEYPLFSGAPDSAAAGLNQQVQEVVARQRASFEAMVKTTPADLQVGPHGLYMSYEVRHNDGKYVSLYFSLSTYSSGAAHPLPYSETLTYDVAQQRTLALGDLFKPGSDYLGVISQKCLAWLQSQFITGGEAGAAATPENYRN